MSRANGEQGWALVSVLWGVAMLAMMAAATQTLTATTQRLERRAWLDARAQSYLEAGVTRAVLGLSDMRASERWPIDATAQEFVFEGARMRISIEDELGRVDLNAADGAVLLSLFRFAGASGDDAERIVDSILDWRTPDGLDASFAAFEEDYRALGIAPRYGAFHSVDELRLIPGVTGEIYTRAAPMLTIFSRSPAVDRSVASSQVLAALGSEPDEWSGTRQRTATIPLSTSLTGRVFRIRVQTDLQGRAFNPEVVMMLTSDPSRPYFTLFWN